VLLLILILAINNVIRQRQQRRRPVTKGFQRLFGLSDDIFRGIWRYRHTFSILRTLIYSIAASMMMMIHVVVYECWFWREQQRHHQQQGVQHSSVTIEEEEEETGDNIKTTTKSRHRRNTLNGEPGDYTIAANDYWTARERDQPEAQTDNRYTCTYTLS
jgi:hypothetical protein